MSTTVAKVLVFTVFALFSERPGAACSCAGPNPVCSVYWTTPLLFLGHVVRIEHVYNKPLEPNTIGPGQYLVHFDVTKIYRGDPSEQLVIHTNDQGSACDYAFETGHDYLVYGYAAPDGMLSTSHCTRTHEVTSRTEDPDLRWIEALPKAPPGVSLFGSIQKQRPNADGGVDSEGFSGIKVSITGPETKTVATDDNGMFRADGLAPGKYVVSAAAPQQYAPFPNSTVTVQDRACAQIVWSTRFAGRIHGHAYFSDGSPAAGIYLTAQAADGNPKEPWTWQLSHTTTTSDGGFDFGEVSPGLYIFGVNMDFAPLDGAGYYRKAFFPGTVRRPEAAVDSVGPGDSTEDLHFFLPPDSAKASMPLEVTVLDFNGKPVPHAEVIAYDDMWENSVTPLVATADENGKATVTLRPGSHYDIEAVQDLPDSSQACAEPIGVDVEDHHAPLVLALSHHFGNCTPFKKRRSESR